MSFSKPDGPRAPSRVIAQRREVQRRWNAGETAGAIAQALGVSERTVHATLARLRLDKAVLRSHPDPWHLQPRSASPASEGLATELRRVAPSVCTVYDAQGRPVARIDPQTRRRVAIGAG